MMKKTHSLAELTRLWLHYHEQLPSANRVATPILQSHIHKLEQQIKQLQAQDSP